MKLGVGDAEEVSVDETVGVSLIVAVGVEVVERVLVWVIVGVSVRVQAGPGAAALTVTEAAVVRPRASTAFRVYQ